MEPLMPYPPPMTADDVSRLTQALPLAVPCGNPVCPKTIAFRGRTKGRPRRYCSGACRAEYSRQREKLRHARKMLEWTRSFEKPPIPEAKLAERQRHIEWLLDW